MVPHKLLPYKIMSTFKISFGEGEYALRLSEVLALFPSFYTTFRFMTQMLLQCSNYLMESYATFKPITILKKVYWLAVVAHGEG